MKNGNIQILDLDFEYKLWKNKLSYYSRELDLLSDRVNVLLREKPDWKLGYDKMSILEIQSNTILSIEKQIRTQEQEMSFYAEDYPINTGHLHYVVHENIRNEMDKINFRQREILDTAYPQLCYPLSNSEIMDS